MARAKDDDGEKEDELELMLLLGANEHRRRSRRLSVRASIAAAGQWNGWARERRKGRLAALSRPIPGSARQPRYWDPRPMRLPP